jgi:hypothetical protein
MIVGFVLFTLGVLLVAMRKPIRQGVKATWSSQEAVKLRMDRLNAISRLQRGFAERAGQTARDIGKLRGDIAMLERILRDRRHVIQDLQSGPLAIRAIPGPPDAPQDGVYVAKVVNAAMAEAAGRRAVQGSFDASWATPQTVIVHAADMKKAMEAIAEAFVPALGFQVTAINRNPEFPAARLFRLSRRFIVPVSVDLALERRIQAHRAAG